MTEIIMEAHRRKIPIDHPYNSILGFHISDMFGMNFHEAVGCICNKTGWVTVVDYVGEGILLLVWASGGAYRSGNILRITIDGEVWREYTDLSENVGPSGWDLVDDSADDNVGMIIIMPFKKFSKSLKVELYNADSSHESTCRVNYLTP